MNEKDPNDSDSTAPGGGIEAAARQRAEAAVAKLGESYLVEAGEQLAALRQAFDALPPRAEQSRGEIAGLARLAHELAGQGSIFGWPLMSEIGNALQHLLRDRAELGRAYRAAVQAHLEVMETALREGVREAAEPRGQDLLAGLAEFEED